MHSMGNELVRRGVNEESAMRDVALLMRAVCDEVVRAADARQPEFQPLWARASGSMNQSICDILSYCGFFSSFRTAMAVVALAESAMKGLTPRKDAVLLILVF